MRPSLLPSVVILGAMAIAGPAAAEPPSAELLARLAHHVQNLDEIDKRATLRLDERIEEKDGDGKVVGTTTEVAHVETTGTLVTHKVVEHAVKDGVDVTAKEQDEANKREAKAKANKGDELLIPFQSDAYVYDLIATDPADPTHVEIAFTPKARGKKTVDGKAWVDTSAGTILSATARMSKPPMFVDWAHLTVVLGAPTPLGPAVSHIVVDANISILFVHRSIHADVKLSGYEVH
jgi:hypothetical protein